MSFEFCNIVFKKIILHTVYAPIESGSVAPFISKQIIELDNSGKERLQERLTKVLGSDSHCIEMLITNKNESGAAQISCDLINCDNDENFAITSAKLALLHTQIHTNKRWPGGALVVIHCTVGVHNKETLIIIKAERHEGFMEIETPEKVEMRYIDNLLLTPETKLYKVGAFVFDEKSASIDDKTKTFVFDCNISAKDDRKAAKYFYSNFLGLSIPQNSEQDTRNFFEYTTEFINKSELPKADKFDLHNALYTYLKTDKNATIETSSFAETYLPDTIEDDYISFMENKKFPTNSIIKNTSLIKSKLRIRKLSFSTEVKITAPADKFSELVELIESSENSTTLKIKGNMLDQMS